MKKKLLLIPTTVFPYIFIAFTVFFFIFSNNPNSLLYISQDNIIFVPIGFTIIVFLSFILNIIFIVMSKSDDSSKILTTALIIKCVQIPAYIAIFLFGLLLSLMIFMTVPLILILILIDLITLFLSSMISIYSIIKVLKEKKSKKKALPVIAIICQFFFCVDVLSLIILKLTLMDNKKALKQ